MKKITCSGCGKTYSVSESKLPADKILNIRCPSCKTIIRIEPLKKEGGIKSPDSNSHKLMQKMISLSKALPPMPRIIQKARQVLSDENSSFKEVGEILETDQAMATRVLKLANSAFYGRTVPLSSVQQAAALMGVQTLLEMVTVVSSSKMMGRHLEGYGIKAETIWRHSLLVATSSKMIALKTYRHLENDAFNAGLLHDSGMLILDEYIKKVRTAMTRLLEKGYTIQHAEKKIFGFDHAEIASEFLKKWNLPSSQLHAIQFHHNPSASEGDILTYILHIADALANLENTEKNFRFNRNALNAIGLHEEEAKKIAIDACEAVNQIIAEFS